MGLEGDLAGLQTKKLTACCCRSGRTAMDEAVMAEAIGPLARFKALTPYKGSVAIKVRWELQ